jgi:AAA15 family ATPase/GTPase
MIVEFSVKNFRSIKELQTISFVATGLKSSKEYAHIDTNNIVEIEGMKLLKTIGIYGANASGKSNIIKAFDFFIRAITSQPSSQSNLASLCEPFRYQENSENTESYFQIVLIIDGIKYRYGFTVKKNLEYKETTGDNANRNSREIVTNEWLFGNKFKNMTSLFERTNNKIEKISIENKDIIPTTLPYQHTLFISHAAAFDNKGGCKLIIDYLQGWIASSMDMDQEKFRRISINCLEINHPKLNKQQFLHLLSTFNLKYDDVILQKDAETDKTKPFPQEKVILQKHYKAEGISVPISFNLKNDESAGTQKLFDLAGLLLLTFNFSKSAFIILDEIDSNFHPSLLIKLIELFNNPEINKSKSQLLFTSHDTNLMSPAIMRRDQFYFTEKNEDNSSRLYSLADLKGIRNDADFAKQYLAGFYGALPVLEDYCQEEDCQNYE